MESKPKKSDDCVEVKPEWVKGNGKRGKLQTTGVSQNDKKKNSVFGKKSSTLILTSTISKSLNLVGFMWEYVLVRYDRGELSSGIFPSTLNPVKSELQTRREEVRTCCLNPFNPTSLVSLRFFVLSNNGVTEWWIRRPFTRGSRERLFFFFFAVHQVTGDGQWGRPLP